MGEGVQSDQAPCEAWRGEQEGKEGREEGRHAESALRMHEWRAGALKVLVAQERSERRGCGIAWQEACQNTCRSLVSALHVDPFHWMGWSAGRWKDEAHAMAWRTANFQK